MKFHQDHKELCIFVDSGPRQCSQSHYDANYSNQNLVWEYTPLPLLRLYQQHSSKQVIPAAQTIKPLSSNQLPSSMKNVSINSISSKKIGPQKFGFKQELHLSNELQAQQAHDILSQTSRNSRPPENKDLTSRALGASVQTTGKQLLNFDIFDRESVFTECMDTHFITNDFDQHSLISSSPLVIPASSLDDLKQSYFEIKIHSGGYYDQI